MRRLLFLLLFIFTFVFSEEAKATHYAGGELLYNWVSGNTFKFTLIIYRDCSGISLPTSDDLCAVNSCTGQSYTFTVNSISGGATGNVISTGCPQSTPATCTGNYTAPDGTVIPIYGKTVYEGNFTFPALCNDWRIFFDGNARNGAITNLVGPGASSLHVEARLNNIDAPTGNSPTFNNLPRAYTCTNTPASYPFECTDIDGDSLVYTSIDPRDQGLGTCAIGVNITYVNAPIEHPYNPFPCNNSYLCNSNNGLVTFTPSAQGVVVITVLVDQYEHGTGIWRGSIIRDFQIKIKDCQNQVNSIYDTLTPTVPIVNNKITACIGDTIAYCKILAAQDSLSLFDSNQHIIIVSQVFPGLPNSLVSITPVSTTGFDSVQVCVVFVPDATQVGWQLIKVNLLDSGCGTSFPVIQQTQSIDSIYVVPRTIGTVDTTICANINVQMGIAQGLGPNFTWNIISGISAISNNSIPNPIVTPFNTTMFTVESDSATALGCPNKDTVTVVVANTPYVNCGPDATICHNATFQMNPTITGTAPSFTYSWSPTTYLSNPNIANPIVQYPDTTITYTLTVTPAGAAACSNIDIIKINVVGGFNITNIVDRDTTICDGASVDVQATGSPVYTYTWLPSADVSNPNILTPTITPSVTAPDSVLYTLYAQYPTCPDSVQSFWIHVEPNPIVQVSNDTLICHQDTANLNSTVLPQNGTYLYEWYPGANVLEPHISQTFYAGNLQNTTELLYLYVVTPIGCFGYDSMFINIDPHHFLTSLKDTTICPLDTVVYSVNGAVQYTWEPAMWLDLPNSNTIKAFPLTTTTYKITGINTHGCVDSAKYHVTVVPNAVVELGENHTIYPGESVNLNPSGNITYFTWSPPYALSSTTSSNPVANPTVTTKYFLEGSTEFGCRTSDSVEVIVMDESYFTVPNAFSPGTGTSSNDYLSIINRGGGNLLSFSIYDRWGEQVFTTKDINGKWDGTYKGKFMPLGVYQYTLEAVTNKGKRISKAGNITLLR